jgi:lipopolysaccharide biosynthesis glycosyltransferase
MATAIVLLCDSNFLVATVGTALAARRHTADPAVGIFVYVLDRDDRDLQRLRQVLLPRGVDLSAVNIAELGLVKSSDFNKTHVPIATMARLWIDDLLPPDYDKFLYLDGDLEIAGKLDSLLATPVPHRGFLAAPDLPLLIKGDWGRSARETDAYLDNLGVSDADDYFNAGVLLVDRMGWADLAAEALAYFMRFPERCRYHDQSALNATAKAKRGRLSLVWNYQTDFVAVADPRRWGISPAIWHFTGFPKPWHADVFPWSNGFGGSFALGAAAFVEAQLAIPPLPEAQGIAAGIAERQKVKFRLRWVYPWRRFIRAQRIRAELGNVRAVAQRGPLASFRALQGYGRPRAVAK